MKQQILQNNSEVMYIA